MVIDTMSGDSNGTGRDEAGGEDGPHFPHRVGHVDADENTVAGGDSTLDTGQGIYDKVDAGLGSTSLP